MAFDGCFLKQIVGELQQAIDAHIDKIYQPSKNELVFLLRKKGFSRRLLLHLQPGAARLQFTENRYENPASPPMFCMLLRKHLSAAKLTAVTQPGVERLAELCFSTFNEMGDLISLRLIGEFLGNKTNLVLVGEDGKIVDALRRTDPETADRLLLPGAVYQYPAGQNKNNPFIASAEEIADAVFEKGGDPAKALLATTDGLSPLVCREIVFRAGGETGKLDRETFAQTLSAVLHERKTGGCPVILFAPDGTPADFSDLQIRQYGPGFTCRTYETYSGALDAFYTSKENHERIRKAAADILKRVGTLYARTEKKLALRLQELQQCQDREHLRIWGELIKANLYRIQNGDTSVTVENFYDDCKPVTIPLNPALSPQNNAAVYFKEYKKSYTAEQTLTALTAQDREELCYLETVLDSISRAESLSEIAEIREELAQAGYIARPVQKQKKTVVPTFLEYTSQEGYRIAVGKNNRQNDYLTTQLAAKNDMWFHVKNIPGSHVVVFCQGKPLSEETLLFAATLAASHSKASASSQVPVDYTTVKNVKKPSGAKPGMVIYTTNKTLYVDPLALSENREG